MRMAKKCNKLLFFRGIITKLRSLLLWNNFLKIRRKICNKIWIVINKIINLLSISNFLLSINCHLRINVLARFKKKNKHSNKIYSKEYLTFNLKVVHFNNKKKVGNFNVDIYNIPSKTELENKIHNLILINW